MRWAVLAALVALWAGETDAQETRPCRQALALGLDVSGSVDAQEYRLQLDGLAAALVDAEVQAALLAMPQAPVRLLVYEWSGPYEQRLLVDWVSLDSDQAIAEVAAGLRATGAAHINDPSTAIGAAMLYGARALAQQGTCWTRTLDISGDGAANIGAHPRDITGQELGGIVINGLIIGADVRANTSKNLANVKTLEQYYRAFVLRGTGAFAEVAADYPDFARAMRRKLLREIAAPALSALPRAEGRVQ